MSGWWWSRPPASLDGEQIRKIDILIEAARITLKEFGSQQRMLIDGLGKQHRILTDSITAKFGELSAESSETIRQEIGERLSAVLPRFDQGMAQRAVKAEDTAWRMEVAANRAARFLRQIATNTTDEVLRERAMGVVIDMQAIMDFADRETIEAMLQKMPDWASKGTK